MVALSAQLEHRTPKEVELYSHLGAQAAVATERRDFVCRKDSQRVAAKVENGDEAGTAEGTQALQCYLALLAQVDVVFPAHILAAFLRSRDMFYESFTGSTIEYMCINAKIENGYETGRAERAQVDVILPAQTQHGCHGFGVVSGW